MLPLVSSDDAEADRHALGAEVRDRLRLVVFVDEEVFLAQAGDEAAAGVRHRRGDVDQLDAALEPEPGSWPPASPAAAAGVLLPVQHDDECGKQRRRERKAANDGTHDGHSFACAGRAGRRAARPVVGPEAHAIPADVAARPAR